MLPLRIIGHTRVLAKDQPEYFQLAIRDVISSGRPFMLSAWELSPAEVAEAAGIGVNIIVESGEVGAMIRPFTPEELASLRDGGHVILALPGHTHPPVKPAILNKTYLAINSTIEYPLAAVYVISRSP